MSLSILLLRSSNTNNSNNNNNNSKENQDVATIDNKDSTIASDTNKSLSEGISKLQSLSLVEGPNATDKSVDASSSTDGNTKPLTTISETLSEENENDFVRNSNEVEIATETKVVSSWWFWSRAENLTAESNVEKVENQKAQNVDKNSNNESKATSEGIIQPLNEVSEVGEVVENLNLNLLNRNGSLNMQNSTQNSSHTKTQSLALTVSPKTESNDSAIHSSPELEAHAEEAPVQTQEVWVDWSLQYRRVSSVVSYVYNRGSVVEDNDFVAASTSTQACEVNNQVDESTPLISQPLHTDNTNALYSWISWPSTWWGTQTPSDEDDDDEGHGPHNSELYKLAKNAIENSKESPSHYAIKCSNIGLDNSGGVREMELSVCGTITEAQPVKYKAKKRPLFPNEVQERNLQLVAHSTEKLIVPTIAENLRTITLRTKLRLYIENLLYGAKSSERHLYTNKPDHIAKRKALKIRKVVIIGIHGFLPIKLVRTLIGQSTGNSIRYINEASKAIRCWLEQNNPNYRSEDYDVQSIALEGEGKINERVDKLLHLLKNWHDLLSAADFVFVVSHGQGTPVAINLLAEILKRSILRKKQKLGLLSMSGITAGPYGGMDLKLVIRAYSAFENSIIAELFELQKPTSKLSLQLQESLGTLVKNNVKITFVGSINDQFIPISSTLALHVNHPNIFRGIYVGPTSTGVPSFIVSLFKIIVMMKNMGHFNDYGFLKELGDKCMGSTNDGGHCKIYGDQEVYELALRYTLETTNLVHNSELQIRIRDDTSDTNLYALPWNFRCLIQDLVGVNNICNIQLIQNLLTEFRAWKEPMTKQWREVRYCLEFVDEVDIEEFLL